MLIDKIGAKIAQNSQKWPKRTKMAKKGQKKATQFQHRQHEKCGQKWTKSDKKAKIATKWPKMAKKFPKITKKFQTWPKNCKKWF